jgi:hypothetical protein
MRNLMARAIDIEAAGILPLRNSRLLFYRLNGLGTVIYAVRIPKR